MLQDYMARRTCFREQYYTDTRRYICVREDCRQYQAETICDFVMVFHQYLRIGEFVWDLVLCGTRYYQSASVDCSGVIQKIHMRELEVGQGIVSMMNMIDFMITGRSARPNAALMAQGSALTRNVIQYMARRTCFKEQYYTDMVRSTLLCVHQADSEAPATRRAIWMFWRF